ncbi:MAG: hypothetical protein OEZ34_00455 [Spirochaetia bacterium]|nr:hypothetical protein [Spirochaetia bacterium]
MAFIKIYPLSEIVPSSEDIFGQGEPARCRPRSGLGGAEYYLNLNFIKAFEECPLYLVTEDDPNLLTDGIRILLSDGKILVLQDDSEDPEQKFETILMAAGQDGISKMN